MPEPGAYSLRRRVVAAVLVAACVVWAALAFTVHRAVLRDSAVEFDERLAQQARAILLYADHEYAETNVVVGDARAHEAAAQPRSVYQIWTSDGRLIYRSGGAPAAPLADLRTAGFRDVQLASGAWRVYAESSAAHPIIVQIAEPAAHRTAIAARVRATVMVPLLLALPVLAALTYWITHWALRPITRLAAGIAAREPGDMRPLEVLGLPAEIAVLGRALNDLLARHAEALQREARFTGDAAHELRTPLAAVRAQAQVAMRARTPEEAAQALARLIAGVDRANRLVTQLLSLARLENAQGGTAARHASLRALAAGLMQDLADLARAHGVRIDAGDAPDLTVPEEAIYLMLRNLVDNAIRHSPRGGVVRIDFRAAGGRLAVTVRDQGPGIPAGSRERVFERFHRDTREYEGSGLGLSIVARVLEMQGGAVELADAPGGGLQVSVDLPLTAAA